MPTVVEEEKVAGTTSQDVLKQSYTVKADVLETSKVRIVSFTISAGPKITLEFDK
jgi:hypothetical protein